MYEDVAGYRHEVDMWAIGVIMFTLLCGAPPFWHRKQMQMLRMIMQANYSFGTPEWDDISQPPKDLVSGLINNFYTSAQVCISSVSHVRLSVCPFVYYAVCFLRITVTTQSIYFPYLNTMH